MGNEGSVSMVDVSNHEDTYHESHSHKSESLRRNQSEPPKSRNMQDTLNNAILISREDLTATNHDRCQHVDLFDNLSEAEKEQISRVLDRAKKVETFEIHRVQALKEQIKRTEKEIQKRISLSENQLFPNEQICYLCNQGRRPQVLPDSGSECDSLVSERVVKSLNHESINVTQIIQCSDCSAKTCTDCSYYLGSEWICILCRKKREISVVFSKWSDSEEVEEYDEKMEEGEDQKSNELESSPPIHHDADQDQNKNIIPALSIEDFTNHSSLSFNQDQISSSDHSEIVDCIDYSKFVNNEPIQVLPPEQTHQRDPFQEQHEPLEYSDQHQENYSSDESERLEEEKEQNKIENATNLYPVVTEKERSSKSSPDKSADSHHDESQETKSFEDDDDHHRPSFEHDQNETYNIVYNSKEIYDLGNEQSCNSNEGKSPNNPDDDDESGEKSIEDGYQEDLSPIRGDQLRDSLMNANCLSYGYYDEGNLQYIQQFENYDDEGNAEAFYENQNWIKSNNNSIMPYDMAYFEDESDQVWMNFFRQSNSIVEQSAKEFTAKLEQLSFGEEEEANDRNENQRQLSKTGSGINDLEKTQISFKHSQSIDNLTGLLTNQSNSPTTSEKSTATLRETMVTKNKPITSNISSPNRNQSDSLENVSAVKMRRKSLTRSDAFDPKEEQLEPNEREDPNGDTKLTNIIYQSSTEGIKIHLESSPSSSSSHSLVDASEAMKVTQAYNDSDKKDDLLQIDVNEGIDAIGNNILSVGVNQSHPSRLKSFGNEESLTKSSTPLFNRVCELSLHQPKTLGSQSPTITSIGKDNFSRGEHPGYQQRNIDYYNENYSENLSKLKEELSVKTNDLLIEKKLSSSSQDLTRIRYPSASSDNREPRAILTPDLSRNRVYPSQIKGNSNRKNQEVGFDFSIYKSKYDGSLAEIRTLEEQLNQLKELEKEQLNGIHAKLSEILHSPPVQSLTNPMDHNYNQERYLQNMKNEECLKNLHLRRTLPVRRDHSQKGAYLSKGSRGYYGDAPHPIDDYNQRNSRRGIAYNRHSAYEPDLSSEPYHLDDFISSGPESTGSLHYKSKNSLAQKYKNLRYHHESLPSSDYDYGANLYPTTSSHLNRHPDSHLTLQPSRQRKNSWSQDRRHLPETYEFYDSMKTRSLKPSNLPVRSRISREELKSDLIPSRSSRPVIKKSGGHLSRSTEHLSDPVRERSYRSSSLTRYESNLRKRLNMSSENDLNNILMDHRLKRDRDASTEELRRQVEKEHRRLLKSLMNDEKNNSSHLTPSLAYNSQPSISGGKQAYPQYPTLLSQPNPVYISGPNMSYNMPAGQVHTPSAIYQNPANRQQPLYPGAVPPLEQSMLINSEALDNAISSNQITLAAIAGTIAAMTAANGNLNKGDPSSYLTKQEEQATTNLLRKYLAEINSNMFSAETIGPPNSEILNFLAAKVSDGSISADEIPRKWLTAVEKEQHGFFNDGNLAKNDQTGKRHDQNHLLNKNQRKAGENADYDTESGYNFSTKRLLLMRDSKDRFSRGNGIGMRIIGGQTRSDGLIGAFVEEILGDDPAEHLHGEILEGDEILEWNGISLIGKSFEEVQNIISSTAEEIELVVRVRADRQNAIKSCNKFVAKPTSGRNTSHFRSIMSNEGNDFCCPQNQPSKCYDMDPKYHYHGNNLPMMMHRGNNSNNMRNNPSAQMCHVDPTSQCEHHMIHHRHHHAAAPANVPKCTGQMCPIDHQQQKFRKFYDHGQQQNQMIQQHLMHQHQMFPQSGANPQQHSVANNQSNSSNSNNSNNLIPLPYHPHHHYHHLPQNFQHHLHQHYQNPSGHSIQIPMPNCQSIFKDDKQAYNENYPFHSTDQSQSNTLMTQMKLNKQNQHQAYPLMSQMDHGRDLDSVNQAAVADNQFHQTSSYPMHQQMSHQSSS